MIEEFVKRRRVGCLGVSLARSHNQMAVKISLMPRVKRLAADRDTSVSALMTEALAAWPMKIADIQPRESERSLP